MGIAAVIVITLIVTIYWFFFKQEEVKPVSVQAVTPEVVEEKSHVRLKAIVESCQQIKTVVPMDIGYVTQEESLRIIRGYVENRGNVPVNYVRVEVNWRNEDDRTIEYDRIYATAAELLMPGEKTSFEAGKNNVLIKKCSAKVVDWWVATGDEEPPADIKEEAEAQLKPTPDAG